MPAPDAVTSEETTTEVRRKIWTDCELRRR
jgi:hypothetical protein